MYKIGFIDEEATQINTFYQTFKNEFEVYEFELNQQTEPEEIIFNVFDNHLDALIVDYRMDDYFKFNGNILVEKLDEINPFFPRVILTSYPLQALDFVDDPHIVNTKDVWSGDSASDLEIFTKKLNRIINSYYEKINDSEEELKALEEKRKESKLDENDQKKYVELNAFLSKTVGEKKDLVETYYSQETDEKLENLIEKTEAILDKLSEK